MIKVLRVVRNEAVDAGIKFAIENHKELLCWETRQVIDGAGKEFVGSYLDTGNPVFVMEDPMQTVETLGPVALMLHLRDSVVYESRGGIAVQWVPLGEGVVDFQGDSCQGPRDLSAARGLQQTNHRPSAGDSAGMGCRVHEQVRGSACGGLRAIPGAGQEGWPYERHMVIEDVPGKTAEPLTAALTYQQREHMERGVEYAKKVLDLGVRWRVG
jgi:hypothetical protein